MILTLKNKHLLGLKNLIDEANKSGGVPKEFVLSKTEFALLLIELNELGKASDDINIKSSRDDSILIKIYRETLTNKSINLLIDNWIAKNLIIEFKKIPITYDAPKPEKKETEKKETEEGKW